MEGKEMAVGEEEAVANVYIMFVACKVLCTMIHSHVNT
jgi:hypothetical protein